MNAIMRDNLVQRVQEIRKMKEKEIHTRVPESLVIKLTHRCNLSCEYCYMGEQYCSDMTAETAYSIIKKIDDKLDRDITVYFHGGEPMLCLDAIRFIGDKIAAGCFRNRFHLMIQTNGTIFNDDIISICRKYNLHVGISIDSVIEANNKQRCYPSGKNSLPDILATMSGFHENQIPFGVVSVLTDTNVRSFIDTYREICRYGVYEVTATLPVLNGRADKVLLSDIDALVQVYKDIINFLYFNNRQKKVEQMMFDRTLKWITRSLFHNTKGYMCQNCPCGAGIRTAVFDTNGDVYACDLFSGDKDFYLGNAMVDSLDKLFSPQHSVIQYLYSRNIDSIAECRVCEWKHVCSSDCCAKAYYYHKTLHSASPYCRFFKEIIPYLYYFIKDNGVDPILFSGDYNKDIL